jgi:hypothetical protein
LGFGAFGASAYLHLCGISWIGSSRADNGRSPRFGALRMLTVAAWQEYWRKAT